MFEPKELSEMNLEVLISRDNTKTFFFFETSNAQILELVKSKFIILSLIKHYLLLNNQMPLSCIILRERAEKTFSDLKIKQLLGQKSYLNNVISK